jgi:serine/threonine protein kinase
MTTTPLPFPQTASTPVGPVVPLPAGVSIDRFVVEQTLHQGPHGFAYRVREPGHQQPLVLLECFPRALAIRQPDGAVRARQAGDAIALSVVCEAFVQDARALAVVDHPGVVKVFGVINANRTVYRLMPFIDGQTLEEQRLERAEAPTVGGLVRLYDKLLDALEALHKAGFVHGLVQPDQILMKADDNAPLLLGMDGVAMELGEMTMSPWAAPEQQQTTRFERINASADLYMLAATMCFAATGAAPPRAEERLANAAWDPAKLLADVPMGGGDSPALRDAFIQAVTASLALAAPARPHSANDVRHILHPQGHTAFVATTGPAPLWVGEVPDRDSQWETLEGMSGPVPLQDNLDTQIVMEPQVPSPPPPERRGVRQVERAEPTLDVAAVSGRRTASVAVQPRRSGLAMMSIAAGIAAIAALVWWSQKSSSNLVLPSSSPSPSPAVVVKPAAAPPVAQATPPAAAPVVAAPAREEPRRPPAPAPQVKVEPASPPAVAVVAEPAPTPASTPASTSATTSATTAATALALAPAPTPAPASAPIAAPAPTPLPTSKPATATAKAAPPIAVAPKVATKAPAKAAPKPTAPKAVAKRNEKPAAPAPKTAQQRTVPAEALCGSRTQFSYLYCMQEQCARVSQRNNTQCAALRRTGELR